MKLHRHLGLGLALLALARMIAAADEITIRKAAALEFTPAAGTTFIFEQSANLGAWTPVSRPEIAPGRVVNQVVLADADSTFFRASTYAMRDLTAILEGIRAARKLPALACAVVRSNRIVGIGVTGVRKFGVAEPVTLADKWHHGSLTKSMTATLAALFVQEGRLNWNTKLVDVFPQFAAPMHEDWKTVTLEQLVSNRAGAPEDLTPGGIWNAIWNFGGTPREARRLLLQRLTVRAPNSKPGTKYEYSNAGFALAGAMLEETANRPWEDLLRERLFQPLGMTSAGFGVPATPRHIDHPWGHTLVNGQPSPMAPGTDADNPPAIGPAGTVHCSLPDFARYAAFHLAGDLGHGELLQPAYFTKLHTAVAGQDYALGWNVGERTWAGGKTLSHTGSNLQWYTNVWLAPGKDWACVVLTNFGGAGAFEATDAVVARMIQEFR